MTVRTFIVGAIVAAVLGAGIWALVINFLDPGQAGIIGYILFFLSLFLAVASCSALFGFGVRRLLSTRRLAAYAVRPALRQGVMIGLFLVVLLLLIRVGLYQWWVALILTVLCVALELVFLSYDRALRRKTPAAHSEYERE